MKDVICKQDKVLVFVNVVRLNFKKECDHQKTNLTKYLTAEIASLNRVYKKEQSALVLNETHTYLS